MSQLQTVNIFLGSMGMGMAPALYREYCEDHFIGLDGKPADDSSMASLQIINKRSEMFRETQAGQWVANALLFDTENYEIDRLLSGKFKSLFSKDQTSCFKESSITFTRGYYTVGGKWERDLADRIRQLVEKLDHFQGVQCMLAADGGTGSGIGARLFKHISVDYPKKMIFCAANVPYLYADMPIADYNVVPFIHRSIEHTSVQNFYDNTAIGRLLESTLDVYGVDLPDINTAIARSIAKQSAPSRLSAGEGSLSSMREICTTMVPYPRTLFLMPSLVAPRNIEGKQGPDMSLTELTANLFSPEYSMLGLNAFTRKIYTASCFLRGNINMMALQSCLSLSMPSLKSSWINWSPKLINYSLDRRPWSFDETKGRSLHDPLISKQGGASLINGSCMLDLLESITGRYDTMYAKRSHVHCYVGEGIESNEFNEYRQGVDSLITDYIDLDIVVDDDRVING